jgi:hypothetical protein
MKTHAAPVAFLAVMSPFCRASNDAGQNKKESTDVG